MSETEIIIRGAREHNLQDVHLNLPKNKLICMTGVSGSGKSSLAFDTLYAEGQRRYVESLSSYARQFLGQLPKPEVDTITGLAPSISIQQKATGRNPRSTVGTITEIYDYLRVLMARVGTGYCPQCHNPITAQTTEQILESIFLLPEGTRYLILVPVVQQQKGEFKDLFEDLLKQGYLRARVDGKQVSLNEDLQLDRQMRHSIEVIVDRLVSGKAKRSRVAEAVENALRLSGGSLIISTEGTDSGKGKTKNKDEAWSDRLYNTKYACVNCELSYEVPTPQLFSFNSPQGMCLECTGLGMRHDFLKELLIPDPKLSFSRGAVTLIGSQRSMGRWRRHIYRGVANAIEKELKLPKDSVLKTPWQELKPKAQDMLLNGTGDLHITYSWGHSGGTWKHGGTFEGIINDLLDSYRKTSNPMRRKQLEKYMEIVECTSCQGTRLNEQARAVQVKTRNEMFSRPSMSLSEICSLSVYQAACFFEELDLDETKQIIAEEVLKEIRGRLGFLLRCGLDYLSLDRTAPTLSGGETQRIRLAGQIGCGLVGVVYILDEPSIGLHPRDNYMLLESLQDLRDQGNTVIVVEHDEDTMRAADHIIDFGPGPGVRGGEVVAEGTLKTILDEPRSLTGQFLSGKQKIEIPEKRREPGKEKIKITGATHHNLKNVDAEFPLKTFTCVTGVSGSGKSSLVNDILWKVLNKKVNQGKGKPGQHKRVTGLKYLDKAIDIDQSPIGRTPRSNPATYVKLFDEIRKLFSSLPEAKVRGYKPGRFSFNVYGGRCESCEGHGSNKLEMDFLADVWVTCPLCAGKRFNHETLEVRYKGASIADVLDMDVQQALVHFKNLPRIKNLLQTLHDVGLDYLKLGQPSPTLSGGEAQRIKLARELGKRSTGNTIYLLDEPTTGLHFADIQKLLEVLHGFVDAGNTVLVIEHNLDVIKTADRVIDLGPEGGEGGGTILACGTPEEIANSKESYTGEALASVLPSVKKKRKSRRNGSAKDSAYSKTKGHFGARWQIASNAASPKLNGARKNIIVQGAGQHNLREVDVTIPRDQMSVFCGPSGSGKTSLAMDTLYAEGQRRYVESLSSYARQFLGQMPKPKVDHIHGLSPSIAIEQKSTGHTPRSTVGTATEIYDYLRVLFARLGTMYCPDCNLPVESQTTDQVIEQLMSMTTGTKIMVLAPQEVTVGQKYEALWEKLQSQGFLRVRIDGTTYRLEDVPDINRRRKHQVEIVIDRITISEKGRTRVADSVEMAFDLGRGMLHVAFCDDEKEESEWKVQPFSLFHACKECGRSFESLSPHQFSFNSPLGWCEACDGLGVEQGTNLSILITDPYRSIKEGAINVWPEITGHPLFKKMLDAVSKQFQIPLDVPYIHMEPDHQRAILYGTGEKWISLDKKGKFKFQYKGLFPAIEEASRVSYSYRKKFQDLVGEIPCSWCHGSRLREEASAVRFQNRTIHQICELPLSDSLDFLKTVKLDKIQKKIAGDLLTEAISRLSFLVDVGLDYLSLSRPLPTLSGGESQRIRLAGQIGRALTGVLYVLDEPTIGLHQRDNDRLIQALIRLRDLGNTLILVEHDRDVLKAADRLYDFGPGAGRLGGHVVTEGSPFQISKRKKSLTGQYLSDKKVIPIPKNRRMEAGQTEQVPPGGGWLELLGAKQHNLRDVDLRIPLGTFVAVTGVSGSGKSSLIEDTLGKALSRLLHRTKVTPAPHEELNGIEHVNKVITVDQQPLGSTPSSNPATYTGVFDHIRDLFSRLPDSKVRGYRPGRFSFNRPGGRCDDCEGNGQKCIEMHFLPDVWIECDTCHGKRYNKETLNVKYRGHSIADVLELSIGQALELFENIPKIRGFLATLCAIGLDYLTLGQSAPTLSGGEAQRVKLAAELARPSTGKTVYILDEPTTGLHFDDIAKLLKVLNSLVEAGNTVIVIEHNLDVIKTADWIVDVGPEAGSEGGWIVATGTPEEIVEHHGKQSKQSSKARNPLMPSHTGAFLKDILSKGVHADLDILDTEELSRKKEGDMELRDIGKDARMPWQTDGERWHTEDRLSHQGKPCRWEGDALRFVVDYLSEDDQLAEVNWNDRGTVEIKAKEKTGSWFFHALTADEWLLNLKFRVKKKTFDLSTLRKRFPLKPLDQIDELPVYKRSERIRVRNTKGPWQEVTVAVHWLKEIETPEFRKFLDEAKKSFLSEVNKQKLDPESLMPWKVLKRGWHVSRKGFPANKRASWKADTLEALFDLLLKFVPEENVDWTGRQVVTFYKKGKKKVWATVVTKRRAGIDLCLYGPPDRYALGGINQFGKEQEITQSRDGREMIKIRFTEKKLTRDSEFKKFLGEHIKQK